MRLEQLEVCATGQQVCCVGNNLVLSVIVHKTYTDMVFTKGWTELTGLSHEKLVTEWIKAVHPDDRDECEILWKRALRGVSQQFDFRIRRKDGTYICLLADIVPVGDGLVGGIVGTFIDISSRKLREISTRQNYELVSLVSDSLHVLIVYIGSDRRYIYVNRGYLEFWNLSREEIIGKHIAEVLGENFRKIESRLNNAFEGEKQRYEVTIDVNGEARRCSVAVVPHFEDAGEVKGVFILVEPLNDDVVHSHFEDLERFMSHWQDDPLGLCNFAGRAIARLGHRRFSDLFFAIGTSYFAHRCLPDRIDHLYRNHKVRIGGIKGDTIRKMIDIDRGDDDVICLRDKNGRHNNVELLILRRVFEGHLTYFLKPVDGDSVDFDFDFDDCEAWNFRRPDDIMQGVIAYPESRGFFDLAKTQSVADLIVLASNLVGFVSCEC